jgi:hypothetical protein
MYIKYYLVGNMLQHLPVISNISNNIWGIQGSLDSPAGWEPSSPWPLPLHQFLLQISHVAPGAEFPL